VEKESVKRNDLKKKAAPKTPYINHLIQSEQFIKDE
jgi:hypothetical protein